MDYKFRCELLELRYVKIHKKGLSIFRSKVIENCFPQDWILCEDYEYKCSILEEAIEKKCLIKDTDLYLGIVEGVRNYK